LDPARQPRWRSCPAAAAISLLLADAQRAGDRPLAMEFAVGPSCDGRKLGSKLQPQDVAQLQRIAPETGGRPVTAQSGGDSTTPSGAACAE
jgi:hypothetical protein